MESRKVKRIAIVAYSFPPLGGGGVTISHYNLFQGLRNGGYETRVFTYGDGHSLRREDDIVRAGLSRTLQRAIHRIVRIAFKVFGDQRVTYQFADSIIGSIGGLSIWPRIFRYHPDVVIVPDQGAPSAFWPHLKNMKTVLVTHHNPLRFLNEPLFGLHSAGDAHLALKLETVALKKVAGVICPSRYVEKILSETFCFNGPVQVIPNVIDSESNARILPANPQEMGMPVKMPIVYIPSAGSPFKGKQFVFEIIRRLVLSQEEDMGFYLSGEIGVDLARCLSFLPNQAHVFSPGMVSNDANIAYIKASTICVSPTLIENFGMSLLEAQYCGLPVVTFDVGGNAEIVENGRTGFLVPFMDVEGIVNRSIQLIQDQQLRIQMNQVARQSAEERFSARVLVDKYGKFFETLA